MLHKNINLNEDQCLVEFEFHVKGLLIAAAKNLENLQTNEDVGASSVKILAIGEGNIEYAKHLGRTPIIKPRPMGIVMVELADNEFTLDAAQKSFNTSATIEPIAAGQRIYKVVMHAIVWVKDIIASSDYIQLELPKAKVAIVKPN